MVEAALHSEIEAVLARYASFWNARTLKPIAALWDADDSPFVLPQELNAPVIGWDAYHAYLSRAEARLKRCSMRIWDVQVKRLSTETAMSLHRFHWNGEIIDMENLFGIDSRATANFRLKPEGWKICSYVEAPESPMLHLQRYYETQVDPSFRNG